ncbi:transcription initiation factor IID, 31kD subunit-domain-containing protein [Lipomyces japonicus]|uniref:transcription initiation factor IID, 31kD subunit-domain-containing protein n=1 Tax=Lipomyces japonicus TaxID=56871 RepID=UPI0034CDB5FA
MTEPQSQPQATQDVRAETAQDLPSATPRDARLLHLMMASLGINNYQDRVPLQLMDFAHRYTTGILEDSILYADHARSSNPSASTAANTQISVEDVRLSVAARVNYQFKPAPPKELLLELAQERNRKPLPPVPQTYGIRLPPEKYCLTAKDWDIDEELAELPDDSEVLPEPKRQKSG